MDSWGYNNPADTDAGFDPFEPDESILEEIMG